MKLIVAGVFLWACSVGNAAAQVTWDATNFRCSFALNLSEATAIAEVTVSRWRDIQTNEIAVDLLNRALQAAFQYCRSPGHEVRNPYNQIVPVRWGSVVIQTESRRQLVNATARPDGTSKAEGSDLPPGATLVAAVKQRAAVEAAEEQARRAEAERRAAEQRAREEEAARQAEIRAREAAEKARRKEAALQQCGNEPVLIGGPWRSYVSSAYKFAVQDMIRQLTDPKGFGVTYLCVKSAEYMGDAPNPFGGNASRLKFIGADFGTYEMVARIADVAY